MTRLIHRAAVAFVAATTLAGCGSAAPPVAPEVIATTRAAIPSDPADTAWRDVPQYTAALLLQDMVEPRLMQPSTPAVRVQAVTDGTRVAFLLQWDDAELNDLPKSGSFVDACAVQLPAATAADLPAPQMGEAAGPVEITYWRASWQAVVNGRGDTINDIHPNATVDHYPFEAASLPKESIEQREMALRYAPARALGNTMAGPRTSPVEDLIAHGPGTLEPGTPTGSAGRGSRTATGWAVVISRLLPANLTPGTRGQVAFAVWQGSAGEAGAKKMRTGWVPIAVEAGS